MSYARAATPVRRGAYAPPVERPTFTITYGRPVYAGSGHPVTPTPVSGGYARRGFRGLADFTIPGDPTIHPGCDPFDTACVEAMLRTQSALLCPPGTDQSHCFGNPGYDAYVQQKSDLYRAQIAAGPQPVYMLPNGQPAASVEQYRAAWSDPKSTTVAMQTFNTPATTKAAATSTGIVPTPGSGSNYVPQSEGSEAGGFSFPLWGIAAAAAGLFLIARSR